MDIQRCFEILEIDHSASPKETKQAYKDMVNIWHPDRVSNNPRLKQKAEEKLKEVNVAYETVKSFLNSKKEPEPEHKETSQAEVEPEYYNAQQEPIKRDKTELAFETGTRMFLNLCSYLYNTFRRTVESQGTESDTEDRLRSRKPSHDQWQRGSNMRGQAKGRGRGHGKGMGKGVGRGGRMGRGMGKGR